MTGLELESKICTLLKVKCAAPEDTREKCKVIITPLPLLPEAPDETQTIFVTRLPAATGSTGQKAKKEPTVLP
ncbi:MAG: hypothetical protein ABIF10_04565, partial [Candidatus Woesearchaeota archaeon]